MNGKIMKKLSVFIAVVLVAGTILSSLAWLPDQVKAASGGSGTAVDPYIITTATQLNNVRNGLSSYYKLGNDIDLSSYTNWVPIGNSSSNFRGGFDGDGHTITGLTINRVFESYIGLFGFASLNGQIRNVNLSGVNVVGNDYVGSLVGNINYGKVENSSASGTVKGYRQVGGLAGRVENSAVLNGSSANVTVNGYANVGGLIGQYSSWASMADNSASGNVTGTGANIGGLVGDIGWGAGVANSHASGNVTGTNSNSFYLGGLIGSSNSNLIQYSYATGDVLSKGGTHIGGLIGAGGGTIEKSYASGHITVEGGSFPHVGGLIGRFDFGTIINSYANGSVTGDAVNTLFGGLVGDHRGKIENSYTVVPVSGNGVGSNGPLVGMNGGGTVINSYYNIDVAGQSDNGQGTAKTTAELMSAATFTDWDFNTVWSINEGIEYPKVRPFVVMTYTIDALEDKTLTALTEGYVSGTQETRTITITRTGTGTLANLSVALSGTDAHQFELAGPAATTLNDATPATTFTVKAKDNLPLGTYNATVTVKADQMTNRTFAVTQAVNAKVVIKGDANGDGAVTPADALMITQYTTGKITLTPEQFNALDMNNDGVLNSVDVQMIMAVYLGGAGK